MSSKTILRKHYLAIRHNLKPREMPPEKVLPLLTESGYVLSFCSTKGEIGTADLNEALRDRLALPKVEGDELHLYSVIDLKQLKRGPFDLHEPNPKTCGLLPDDEIAYILVPGLAFDHERHRLGYGKGFYDRLLKRLPNVTSIGLGYREQLSKRPLPIEPHDVQLDKLILS